MSFINTDQYPQPHLELRIVKRFQLPVVILNLIRLDAQRRR
ncbi:MAG: hypothetical protein U0903_16335 [Planctomycetales bacterium]